jgi:hypothetical protein
LQVLWEKRIAVPQLVLLAPALDALQASDWQPVAAPLLKAWEEAVRASSAVENWLKSLASLLGGLSATLDRNVDRNADNHQQTTTNRDGQDPA